MNKGDTEKAVELYLKALEFLGTVKDEAGEDKTREQLKSTEVEEITEEFSKTGVSDVIESTSDSDSDSDVSSPKDDFRDTKDTGKEDLVSTAIDPEVLTLRSTINSNLSACYVKLKQWTEVKERSTLALKDNPDYTKARVRRATACEMLKTSADLKMAIDDYTFLDQTSHKTKINQLTRDLRIQEEKEKEEVMGKLKELGNSFLGYFGLSTDNFVMQDNGQGGQSITMKK